MIPGSPGTAIGETPSSVIAYRRYRPFASLGTSFPRTIRRFTGSAGKSPGSASTTVSARYWSVRRMHGTWYASDISIAWCASAYASSTEPGESTRRGNSPCPADRAKASSSCPVRVGIPVAGPGRIPSATTTGVSSIPASESASTIRANPPPEVATIARAPAYEAPIAMFRAAISSSACSKTSPSGGPSTESPSRMPLPGVIGYPAANLHPPATAPRASASFPDRIIRGWNAASGRRYPAGTRGVRPLGPEPRRHPGSFRGNRP